MLYSFLIIRRSYIIFLPVFGYVVQFSRTLGVCPLRFRFHTIEWVFSVRVQKWIICKLLVSLGTGNEIIPSGTKYKTILICVPGPTQGSKASSEGLIIMIRHQNFTIRANAKSQTCQYSAIASGTKENIYLWSAIAKIRTRNASEIRKSRKLLHWQPGASFATSLAHKPTHKIEKWHVEDGVQYSYIPYALIDILFSKLYVLTYTICGVDATRYWRGMIR